MRVGRQLGGGAGAVLVVGAGRVGVGVLERFWWGVEGWVVGAQWGVQTKKKKNK